MKLKVICGILTVVFTQFIDSYAMAEPTIFNVGSAEIVLVQITDVSIPTAQPGKQLETPLSITYKAKVLADSQEQYKHFEMTEIHGKQMQEGSFIVDIPTWNKGDCCLLLLRATNQQNVFDYADLRNIPLGLLNSAEVIKPSETDGLKQAVSIFGKISRSPDQQMPRQQVLDLMKSPNYYLWALGIAAFASQADKNDFSDLIQIYRNRTTTRRQIIWLDQCFDYLPSAIRPTDAQRYQLLQHFVQAEHD